MLDTHLSTASCVLIDSSGGPETAFANLIYTAPPAAAANTF